MTATPPPWLQRIDQLTKWITDTYPKVFWLSGFTYPTGFLTAVLQVRALGLLTVSCNC